MDSRWNQEPWHPGRGASASPGSRDFDAQLDRFHLLRRRISWASFHAPASAKGPADGSSVPLMNRHARSPMKTIDRLAPLNPFVPGTVVPVHVKAESLGFAQAHLPGAGVAAESCANSSSKAEGVEIGGRKISTVVAKGT
jgi:hypothetical protein